MCHSIQRQSKPHCATQPHDIQPTNSLDLTQPNPTLRHATTENARPRHAMPRHTPPHHATSHHATPRHATTCPRHATPALHRTASHRTHHATPQHTSQLFLAVEVVIRQQRRSSLPQNSHLVTMDGIFAALTLAWGHHASTCREINGTLAFFSRHRHGVGEGHHLAASGSKHSSKARAKQVHVRDDTNGR